MPQQSPLPLVDVDAAFSLTDLNQRRTRSALKARLDEFLAAIYATEYGSQEKEQFALLWEREQAIWLQQLASDHTRRAYGNAAAEFCAWLRTAHAIRFLWQVEPHHAVQWLEYMRSTGNALLDNPKPLSDRTANLRLAALSSLYEHMLGATRLILGIQVGLFVSADGFPRQNPFRSSRVRRPRVAPYGNSRPVPKAAIRWILQRLARKPHKTLANHRDYALLRTFIFTGYRADSVLAMQWCDFQHRQDGRPGMNFDWRGKGNKGKRKAISPAIWAAITAYLKEDGRYAPGVISPSAEMYIWLPVRNHGSRNLAVQRRLALGFANDEAEHLADEELAGRDENRPIAQSTATAILRRWLRRYFVQELRSSGMTFAAANEEARRLAGEYHLHSLRHSFANALDRASGGDIRFVQEALDHEHIETTRNYLESIRDADDRVSEYLEDEYE